MGLNRATGDPAKGWKLVDELKGFNWLNYDAGKFSTSQKRGVFMDTALEILPADYWRWYLISNAPESSDSSFTWAHFAATVNKDLADVLGNFVNRVLKFATARFEGKVPESSDWGEGENAAAAEIADALYDFQRLLFRDHEFRQSARRCGGSGSRATAMSRRRAPGASSRRIAPAPRRRSRSR